MAAQDLRIRISADGSAAIVGMRKVQDELGRTGRSADELNGGFGRIAAGLKSLALTAAAGMGVAELARGFITAAIESQKFQASLTAITGSSEAAGAEMDYIKAVAERLGITLADTATAWISLSAAAKGTALEGQAARDIFEAVGLAMGKLGKSSADTQGALLAIEQMISKGVVSAEELRGQLGERLPGAFKAAADAMGRTEQELGKMLESGEVMAEDLLPALSQRLRELYNDGKEVGGLERDWNRLTNALSELSVTTDQATGATGLLSSAIQSATALARDWEAVIRAVSNAQRGLGFTMGERDELAMLYRERTQLVNEYLGAVERANQAADLSKTPGLAFARDEALAKLAEAERSIQKIRGGLQATAAAAKEAGDAQAQSMGDGAVKLYEEQRAKIDEANQSLLKLNSTYDDTAKRQYQVAEATKQYQEIAKSLGKDEAWVSEQVAKYTASLNKSTQAKGGAAKASKTLAAADREGAKAVAEAERAVQSLIDRYLPARAAAEDYAEAQAVVAAALAGKAGSVSLSAEEADKILAELGKEQAKVASEAAGDADAFADAWKNVVDSLDDTFQGLWRSLITGQGDVLGNLKETVLEWVADLSYQLLISPLIVPIQGSLMGIMGGGAGGMTGTGTSLLGTASNLGTAADLFGFSNPLSSLTSAFGTATGYVMNFASAAAAGASTIGGLSSQAAMLAAQTADFGLAGATLTGQALGSSAIGSAMVAALPVAVAVAAAVAIFSKWQSDQEPRYGTLAAMTGGRSGGLEDSEWGAASGAYVKGSFGLNFGLTDKGSKNMEATELTEVYQALADVSDALAEFFGEDLSSFIEAELQKMSDFGDGLIHLTENEGDLGGAMAALVERIAQAAGRSAEDIGIAFGAMVGDLSGTAEEVGEQIQAAMLASTLAVELSDRAGDALGEMLDLTGDITTDVRLLKGYLDEFGAASETSGETLTRLVSQLGLLDAAAQRTATDLSGLTARGLIALSDALVDAFGSLDAATQAQAFYYDQFTTGTEKLVDAIQAAAEQIGREIPKLQKELLGLSQDVTTTVAQAANEIATKGKGLAVGFAGLTGGRATALGQPAPGFDSVQNAIDEGFRGIERLGEDRAKQLRDQAERWARNMATWQDLKGINPPFLLQVAEGLETYGAALRDLGYEVDRGTQGFLNSMGKLKRPGGLSGGSSPTMTSVTTPGDPNAAILAKLLNDLPKTRQGFEDLIAGLDLTTEAGRKLYAGLLELAPQFDLLYDGAEAFTDWLLGVDETERATRELTAVFAEWGMTLPPNREALKALYASGKLTTEQMAILAAYLGDLSLLFGDVTAEVDTLDSSLSRIQTSLAAYRESENATLGDVNRALAELVAWNAWDMLPSQDDLERTLNTLDQIDPSAYASQSAYEAAQGQIYANLLALEQRAGGGTDQVLDDQDTLDAYDAIDRTAQVAEANAVQQDAQLAILQQLQSTLSALRQELAMHSTAQTVPLRAIENYLIRWDGDGLPATRVA